MKNLLELRKAILELENIEFDFPDEKTEMRLKLTVDAAVEAASELISEGTDGSVEEVNYLTSAVALRFCEKVHGSNQAQLLRTMIMRRST